MHSYVPYSIVDVHDPIEYVKEYTVSNNHPIEVHNDRELPTCVRVQLSYSMKDLEFRFLM